ncbi:hypothetical protein [Nocardia sputi]|uniref:hypothetical protein n=1 Tax=Nocardia sputi TaxID=2943705 RepID=UPI0020BF30F7|nr:hypothetical protein [Nocardia sputi]
MSRDADFVVLHPDGTVVYGSFAPGEGVRAAIRAHVPDLGTQGMGRARAWFADTFSDPELPPNPLAYQVFAWLGYRHPSGWYGPVAVTMEEDAAGSIALLEPDVRATIEELHARMRGSGSHPGTPAIHPAGARQHTADTPEFRGGAGMDQLIADTVTGQGSDSRTVDPADDPLLLPPGPSTEYGPEL